MKKVLFLGCHCDDIELGCAATIHKHKKDWDIHCYTLCSQGYSENGILFGLDNITSGSLSSLGVNNILFDSFQPDHFHKHRQSIWSSLSVLKKEIDPDIVFTQIADEHQDHLTLNQESIRIFRDRTLLAYLSSYRSQRYFNPDTFEQVDKENVEAKLKCMAMYRAFYPHKNYLKEDNVLSLLRTSGIYIQKEFAETYQTITRIGV